MNNKNEDKLVLELLNKVEEKKKQIGNLERPQWQTTCSFKYDLTNNQTVNIQTERYIENLIHMHAFLLNKKELFERSVKVLNVVPNIKFDWNNFSFNQWEADIETRIDQLQIKTKREELAILELRINALITPEQRRTLELEKLVKEIG